MKEQPVPFEIYDIGQIRAVERVRILMENGAVCGVEGLVNELERAEGPKQVRETIFLWQNGHAVSNKQPNIAKAVGLYDNRGASCGTFPMMNDISLRIEK